MAIFDLGTITVSATHSLEPEDAAQRMELLARDLAGGALRDFGMQWRWEGSQHDRLAITARRSGTDVRGEVRLAKGSVSVSVSGKIEIGGLKGAFASDGMVKGKVKDELSKALREAFRGADLRVSASNVVARCQTIVCNHLAQQGKLA